MLPLFACTIFVAAALLFVVQPMVARQVLPQLGGSPAVWNTAMVFFQVTLLAGYFYAHLVSRLTGWRHVGVHGLVLCAPLVLTPIGVRGAWDAETPPTLWLLAQLGLWVGPWFFAVSSAGPLLQRWFSGTRHRRAHDPYFLYAASNAGSLIGLLAYPFLIEAALGVRAQAWWWSIGYALFAAAAIGCSAASARAGRALLFEPAPSPDPIAWGRRGRWVFLAFVPSALFLAVTQHISTDIAAAPLLWVVPLAIYLTSLIIAFSRAGDRMLDVLARAVPIAGVGVVMAYVLHAREPILLIAGMGLVYLLLVGLLCHGRLAADRPGAGRLTEFYLWIAVGGALGGVFNALVAPALFNDVHEYPIALLLGLACLPSGERARKLWHGAALAAGLILLIPAARWVGNAIEPSARPDGAFSVGNIVAVGAPVLACYLASRWRWVYIVGTGALLGTAALDLHRFVDVRHQTRTFFGVHRVVSDDGRMVLMHGTTWHGQQRIGGGPPELYYHPEGPAGSAMRVLAGESRGERVGLIGMGVGALAYYAEPGQTYTFYEIDPAVVEIASNPEWFSFLAACRGEWRVVLGDGRAQMARRYGARYGAIVLDAFSSDAIPVHLLTREAFEMYLGRLEPGGVLLVHISNRHLDLEPVVRGLAGSLGLHARSWFDTAEDLSVGRAASHWIALGRSAEDVAFLGHDVRWEVLTPRERDPVWTDDRADPLSTIRW